MMKIFWKLELKFHFCPEFFWFCFIGLFHLLPAQSHLFQDVTTIPPDQSIVRDHKCGFPVILEANTPKNIEQFRELQLFKLSSAFFDSIYFSPSGHFKIYYTTDGFNAIPLYDRDQDGTPDYLEFLGRSFDRAWLIEIDSLGFQPPPDSSGHSRSVYPVFCRRLSVYGQTWLDFEIPQLTGNNYVTYIEINTNFNNIVNYPGVTDPIVRDSMAIAVTAAHEFNHALQCGYRLWLENSSFYDLWFIESSATFMEEVVAKEVNDYLQYLVDYFSQTNLPLDLSTAGTADYGKVVLEIMLGKLYGPQITRQIWTEVNLQRALPALEKILLTIDTNLAEEMKRLSTWLYFTGNRSVSETYFPDSELFPSVDFVTGSPVKPVETILLSASLPRLSFQWYLSFSESTVTPQLLLKAGPNSQADQLFVTYLDPISKDFYQIPAALSFRLPFTIGIAGLPYAVVNVRDQADYSDDFQIVSRPATSTVSDAILVYPQPLKLSLNQPFIIFANLPPQAELSIFSSNGKFLKSLKVAENNDYLNWDLKTQYGEVIGSGVYIYLVESAQEKQQGKFLIVK